MSFWLLGFALIALLVVVALDVVLDQRMRFYRFTDRRALERASDAHGVWLSDLEQRVRALEEQE